MAEMTELEILIAIHRAIDEAAAQSPAARAIAARYVPGYANETSAGWTQTLDVVLGPPPEAKAAKAEGDEPRGTERA